MIHEGGYKKTSVSNKEINAISFLIFSSTILVSDPFKLSLNLIFH